MKPDEKGFFFQLKLSVTLDAYLQISTLLLQLELSIHGLIYPPGTYDVKFRGTELEYHTWTPEYIWPQCEIGI